MGTPPSAHGQQRITVLVTKQETVLAHFVVPEGWTLEQLATDPALAELLAQECDWVEPSTRKVGVRFALKGCCEPGDSDAPFYILEGDAPQGPYFADPRGLPPGHPQRVDDGVSHPVRMLVGLLSSGSIIVHLAIGAFFAGGQVTSCAWEDAVGRVEGLQRPTLPGWSVWEGDITEETAEGRPLTLVRFVAKGSWRMATGDEIAAMLGHRLGEHWGAA